MTYNVFGGTLSLTQSISTKSPVKNYVFTLQKNQTTQSARINQGIC